MNDFVLGSSQRGRFRLVDDDYELNPGTLQGLREVQSWLAARDTVTRMLSPDWESNEERIARLIRNGPAPARSGGPPEVQRDRAVQQVRAAEVADLLAAVAELEEYKRLARQVNRHARRRVRLFEQEWNNSTAIQRAIMISMSALVGGSALGIILAHEETRGPALDLVGRLGFLEMPWPPGLSFKITSSSAQARYELPLPVEGVRVDAQVNRSRLPGRDVDYQITLQWNLLPLLRSNGIEF